MQIFKHTILQLILISFLGVAACNESPNTAKDEKTDSSATTATTGDPSIDQVYDPAKDLLTVGAAFTKKLADTLGIRMFEVTIKPGDSLPFHSHPDHAIYLMDTSTVLLYHPGQTKADTLSGDAPGSGLITGPYNDAAKNIGKGTVRLLEVDVHRPRVIEMPGKPAYDSTIDAFAVGGASIQKLADTLGIKMCIATMKPGDTAKLHSHPDHTVYVLEGGELAVSFQGGPRQIMKLQKGMGFIAGPLSDAAKNTGKTTIKFLMTHIYRQRNGK